MADSLAISLERPMVTGDLFTVNEQLRRVREILPEISYAIVRDRNGSILAHTFEGSVPEDLRESDEQVLAAASLLGVLESDQGLIFDLGAITDGVPSATPRPTLPDLLPEDSE